MNLNKILPFIPILIAIGLIGYNEINDNHLIVRLGFDNSQNIVNTDLYEEGNVTESNPGLVTDTDKLQGKIVENDSQIDLIKNAEYILGKAEYIQALDSVEDINIKDDEYHRIVSASNSLKAYAESFYGNPTKNTLVLSQKDIDKIQNAYSFAPTIISLIDNAKKIQNNDYNKCDERLVNAILSCSEYTCEIYNPDIGILSPHRVLGENAVGNCGYTFTYDKLPFICGFNEESKPEVVDLLTSGLELAKGGENLAFNPNKFPASYKSVDGENSKQLEGCIMVALGAQLEQFKE